MSTISGFSKLDKREKINWIQENILKERKDLPQFLDQFSYADKQEQQNLEEFSENTIGNFHLPFGVVPNLQLNGKTYCVPMVTEESSVVAAASLGAKFWLERGGFVSEVLDTEKVGQVHFYYHGDKEKLTQYFHQIYSSLIEESEEFQTSMRQRGGGLKSLELLDKTHLDAGYFQLFATFETCDAMGANFINTLLEFFASKFSSLVNQNPLFNADENVEIIMSILSNYTPACVVKTKVECPIKDLGHFPGGFGPERFAERFAKAAQIAQLDPYRATTHNKGIFNGLDAVIIATGNDFRAVEACGHAYAARGEGRYSSLTKCEIEDGIFRYTIEVPLALGTVGGLTSLHPMSKMALEMLGKPSAKELMMIASSIGLSTHFGSLRSLVTYGIQKGHMKMHLKNILMQEGATEEEGDATRAYFVDKTISYKAVRDFLASYRQRH